MQRLQAGFFERNALDVAPDLIGKIIITNKNGLFKDYVITEVEAYCGEEDLACHARKGRTSRTEIMYHNGGHLYVYLIYGMYWMLNVVTGKIDTPQAVLIRGLENCSGPGRVSRLLQIDKSFYGEYLLSSERIWISDSKISYKYTTTPRIGIDYAGEIWKNKPWRFVALKNEK